MEFEKIVKELLHEVRELRASFERSQAATALREQSGQQMADEVFIRQAARKKFAEIEAKRAQGFYDKPRSRTKVAA